MLSIWEKLPPSRPDEAAPIHPVLRGLTSEVQPPSTSLGVTGGIGNSTTTIGSGSGGDGSVEVLDR